MNAPLTIKELIRDARENPDVLAGMRSWQKAIERFTPWVGAVIIGALELAASDAAATWTTRAAAESAIEYLNATAQPNPTKET